MATGGAPSDGKKDDQKTPQDQAYAALVQKLEALLGKRLAEVTRDLDAIGGRSMPYRDLVGRIVQEYGLPEAYASLVARMYRPDPDDAYSEGLARFVRDRTR